MCLKSSKHQPYGMKFETLWEKEAAHGGHSQMFCLGKNTRQHCEDAPEGPREGCDGPHRVGK